MDRIVVYGLGKYGKKLLQGILESECELDIKIVALIDRAHINEEYKYPIVHPDSLPDLYYDYIIVTSEIYYDEIKAELREKYYISSEKIVLWRNWIAQFGDERFYCNICRNSLRLMYGHGHESPIFDSKKIIGGGVRKFAVCPLCGSLDRNRWVWYILENETEIFKKKSSILHFAPEKGIETGIRERDYLEYITADIQEGKADQVVDITNITFPDQKFDYIICNHILEHIKDESKALSELKRCIKEDGKIIFSVPICWEQETVEDDNITTSEQRLLEYGQSDHVRLYGNDLQKRLEKHGFKVKQMRVDEKLPKEEIERLSLIPEDTVWLLTK